MKRALPAIGLFFLAPLVSEYLLGDLPITLLVALVVLAPMYGGGALLIREIVRRTGGGYPRILTLALAYAIFEEAFTTQTLFNPNYLHLNLHLLDHAYLPALGIGAWWTIFVLTLHTVWSITASIALAESLVPARSTTPWLGRTGLAITVVLFLFGAVVSTKITFKQDPFLGSITQLVWSGIICAAVIAAAFLLVKPSTKTPIGLAPNPWITGIAALAAASIFLLTPATWAWGAVAIYAVLDIAMIALIHRWSQASNWSGMHLLSLAGGAALAYAWHGFAQMSVVGTTMTIKLIGNAIFTASLLVLLAIAARRNNHS
ncbi:MAG TPA: hypothetical protein VGL53_26015 [Bryobacteraceae bacterium]|jgi:hypothetical protein